MKLVKVGAAVLNQIPFGWENNRRNIIEAIRAARKEDVTVLCLPELCITGYGCEDDFFRTDLRDRAWQMMEEILPETRRMIVSVGLPVLYKNALFNCAALIVDGVIAGLVAKQNVAGDGIHYEPRWFDEWAEGVVDYLTVHGKKIPIGDLHFNVGGIKVGFEICEDAWVGKRPGAQLAAKGVDIFLNSSASHFSFGKLDIRKRLVLEGSRAFSATYVYSNLLGNEAGRAIYDGGAIIASGGKLMAQGKRFSYRDFELTTAVVDIEQTRMAQARTYSYKPLFQSDEHDCVEIPNFSFPELRPVSSEGMGLEDWELGPHLKEEELARSLALGLFDYMRKTRAQGYTLSLSGGADSSTVACLVSLFVEFGVKQLGLDGFKSRLGHIAGLQDKTDPKGLVSALLVCAYQASRNSSDNTRESAKTLAEALGAKFFEFDISELVENYTAMVGDAIGRKLAWQTDDLALQNIQARVRSPGIWLLANITNSVLLCTSNRSEGAVGYCTMDGDTSGGLAPIAGVDKAFIRKWLRWMEGYGPAGLAPYTALKVVNQQTPGPELRPPEAGQAGEVDLMPYEILDAIEEAAIEENESAVDCYELMRAKYPQYSAEQIATWVEKFYQLWSRNQWKRERLAPALHVASRNLDPRTWRRSPIISGGFLTELREMRSLAKTDVEALEDRKELTSKQPEPQGIRRFADAALLIIDVQNGFGSTGELPVPEAEEVVPIINSLMPHFSHIVATQDWHPDNHVSFAGQHQGRKPGDILKVDGYAQPLFNKHCVAGTKGADSIDGLDSGKFTQVFRKGTRAEVDSFSAFKDNAGGKATGIEEFLREKGVRQLYVTGLATNYCVLKSVLDAVRAGFEVLVVGDACRGIDSPAGSVEASLAQMRKAGVKIVVSDDIL